MGMPNTVPTLNLHHKPDKPYPDFRYIYNLRGKHFYWLTFIPTQSKVQATIIMVTCTYTGPRNNKYQNSGKYGHAQGHNNWKSTTQTRQRVPRFSWQIQCCVKTFQQANPHTYPAQGTSHYYHGNIHSNRSKGQHIPKLWMVQA